MNDSHRINPCDEMISREPLLQYNKSLEFFVGTQGDGVFLSTNHGTSWTAINAGLENYLVQSLAVCGTTLFAGTGGSGVFLSTDNSTKWNATNSGLTNLSVRSLTVSSRNLFAGIYRGGIFLSTDDGASWSDLTGLFACCQQ